MRAHYRVRRIAGGVDYGKPADVADPILLYQPPAHGFIGVAAQLANRAPGAYQATKTGRNRQNEREHRIAGGAGEPMPYPKRTPSGNP